MRLADRLNSFPVIAVAALLLAGLVGLMLGFFTTSKVAPVIRPAELEGALPLGPEGDGPLSSVPLQPRERGRVQPRDNGDRATDGGGAPDAGTSTDAGGGRDETAAPQPPRPDGELRKLPKGRVDTLVVAPQTQQAQGAIDVSVSDVNGNPLPFALLALDVMSGPLGWQLVPMQPQAVPETRGLFRFSPLTPGAYRVRSLQTNYKPCKAEVQLQREDGTEHVSLTFEPMQYSQVEFVVRFEEGDTPEEVELRLTQTGQEDTSTAGRFGSYTPGREAVSGASPPMRYRQRTAPGGVVKLTLAVGQEAQIHFSALKAEVEYQAGLTVVPTAVAMQQEVTLKATEAGSGGSTAGGTVSPGKLAVTLTVNGKEKPFARVNLYRQVDDIRPYPPSTTEGNRYVFQNILAGSWFLVAEPKGDPDAPTEGFHAPFVQQVEVGAETVLQIDIKTGHLRVNATREPGTPDPDGAEARYKVRLRPAGSGERERSYTGDLTGRQSDYIDFFLPVGSFDVRVESVENYANLTVSPVEQSLTMTPGGEHSLNFNIGAACSLSFQVVDASGRPIPGAEYLLTFQAAGSVPESEMGAVEKAGYDGRCDVPTAPAGPVYLMIWTTSTDWNNPDKVLQLDLPPYGTKDLGAIVVQQ